MKATSLSVNLWAPCNAKCPFCISRLTWKTGEHSNDCLLASLPKAYRYAKWHRVDTVLITSNGEPTLAGDQRRDLFTAIVGAAETGFPVIEMQTNGYTLLEPAFLNALVEAGLTTVSISVAHPDPVRSAEIMGLPSDYDYLSVVQAAASKGLVVRVSLNLLADHCPKGQVNGQTWARDYAASLREAGVHQLTIRELGLPDGVDPEHRVPTWIHENKLSAQRTEMLADYIKRTGTALRRLSYGNTVYEFEGLDVTVSTCMTDNEDPDEIRSLILMPDGHVYHSWNHRGSILL